MVTDTRTTIRTDTSRVAEERADTANQAALWIVLAVIACAGLGYAFYHYSNPANNPQATTTSSEQVAPAANDNTSNVNTQTSPNTSNGTIMNNDTSTAPNTGTPTTTPNQPASSSDTPASTGTSTPSTQQ